MEFRNIRTVAAHKRYISIERNGSVTIKGVNTINDKYAKEVAKELILIRKALEKIASKS